MSLLHDINLICTEITDSDREKMAMILHTMFSTVFSWMKMFEFRLRFHWSLFLIFELTILQHWVRQRLGADQATSHYLNQWWSVYWRIYASLGINKLKHWDKDKWPTFNRRRFQMHFLHRKFSYFGKNFHWVHFQEGSNLQYCNIGSSNGSVPSSRLTITWIKDDAAYWHKYAPSEINGLTLRTLLKPANSL